MKKISSLVTFITKHLSDTGAMLVTAESCTGGSLAATLTKHPGASIFYTGGFVSYSNPAKVNMLNVDPADLDRYGAVSKHIAEQMALGAALRLGADYALATTGVAGPDGGSVTNPIGTVWIAIAHPHGVKSLCLTLDGDRTAIIEQTIETALTHLADLLRMTKHKVPN